MFDLIKILKEDFFFIEDDNGMRKLTEAEIKEYAEALGC